MFFVCTRIKISTSAYLAKNLYNVREKKLNEKAVKEDVQNIELERTQTISVSFCRKSTESFHISQRRFLKCHEYTH